MARRKRSTYNRLSGKRGSLIVGVTETVCLALFFLEIPEFWINDGDVFFTNALKGYGRWIFIACFMFGLGSIGAIASLFHGLKVESTSFILVHILWQILLILILSSCIIGTCILLRYEAILRPSATVVIVFCAVPSIVQIWFIFIVLRCYLNLYDDSPFQKKVTPLLIADVEDPRMDAKKISKVEFASNYDMSINRGGDKSVVV